MKTIAVFLLLLSTLPLFAQAPLPKVSSGTIHRHENFPSQFISARNVDVWLPESYNPKRKYPVLYMHDGQMLFDSTITWNKKEWGVDEVASKLIRDKKVKPFIVVGIWNSGASRHTDYFPQKPFESLTPRQQDSLYTASRNSTYPLLNGKIQSDGYLKFLVTELKPFVDKTYATRPGPESTFVAGSSMGGLISMYAVCEYPTVFGGAACLSTHWPGLLVTEGSAIPDAFLNYMRMHLPDPKHHKIYFDFGTATLDAAYPPLQKKVDEVMRAKGFTSSNWMTREFPGADHSEKAWNRRLDIPMIFLLKR